MLGSCYIPDKWPANSRVPQLLRNIWPIFTCGWRLKPREILWLQSFPPGNSEALSGMQMKTFPWGLFLFPSWNLRFGHIQGPTWPGGIVHTAPEVSILNVFLSLGKKVLFSSMEFGDRETVFRRESSEEMKMDFSLPPKHYP